MKRIIYKYLLNDGVTEIILPRHSEFCSFAAQDKELYAWFSILYLSGEDEKRTFIVHPTDVIFEDCYYLATVHGYMGGEVAHLLEKRT